MPQHVIIIGLDALDFGLASKWASEGHMPNFKKLMERSRWGQISNPLGLEAGACWPSFSMGVGPEVHGQYIAPYIFDTTSYELRVRHDSEWIMDPFWVSASKAGKRVALNDIPYVKIAPNFEGVQVADWFTHVRTYPEGLTTKPDSLASEIIAKYGNNPFTDPRRCPTNHLELSTSAQIKEFRDDLTKRVEAKTAFTVDLMKRQPWDLMFTVYHDSHDMGHMCWHLHDPEHERHDAKIAAEVGDPIFDIYVALDAALGNLSEAAGPDATFLLYLSNGIGTERTGSYFFDSILRKLDDAYYGQPTPTQVDQARKTYRKLIPAPVRQKLNQMKAVKNVYNKNQKTAYQRRRFFETIPNHATGGVRINLKGRERFGEIESGAEYDALCARLCKDLAEIINADTGEPIANSVTLTDDMYGGPKRDELPDILVDWNLSAPLDNVSSPLFGTLANDTESVRTGDHVNRDGFYFAAGPDLTPGHTNEAVDVEDFAPTVLTLLGIDIPERKYAGQVIESLTKQPSA